MMYDKIYFKINMLLNYHKNILTESYPLFYCPP